MAQRKAAVAGSVCQVLLVVLLILPAFVASSFSAEPLDNRLEDDIHKLHDQHEDLIDYLLVATVAEVLFVLPRSISLLTHLEPVLIFAW